MSFIENDMDYELSKLSQNLTQKKDEFVLEFMSAPLFNLLMRNRIASHSDILAYNGDSLLRLKGMGVKRFEELLKYIHYINTGEYFRSNDEEKHNTVKAKQFRYRLFKSRINIIRPSLAKTTLTSSKYRKYVVNSLDTAIANLTEWLEKNANDKINYDILSPHLSMSLNAHNISSFEDLTKTSSAHLQKIRGIGVISLAELTDYIYLYIAEKDLNSIDKDDSSISKSQDYLRQHFLSLSEFETQAKKDALSKEQNIVKETRKKKSKKISIKTPKVDTKKLKTYFTSRGYNVIDETPKGSFWVIGTSEKIAWCVRIAKKKFYIDGEYCEYKKGIAAWKLTKTGVIKK